MATQIQRRRGTTAQHATFTGAVGEITVDTDKKCLVVHDGVTPGGFPTALASSVVTPTVLDKCRIHYTTGASTVPASWNKLNCNVVTFDTNGLANLANNRIIPKKPGYYFVIGRMAGTCNTIGQSLSTALWKNGAIATQGVAAKAAFAVETIGGPASDSILFNGTTDYVEMYGYAVGTFTIDAGISDCYLSVIGPF